MVEVQELEVRYGAVPAVRELSLEVGEGEIVGLIGPNGAGKSTTLKMLSGILRPDAGELRVLGVHGELPSTRVWCGPG